MSSSRTAVPEDSDQEQGYDLGELELAPRPTPRTKDGSAERAIADDALPSLSGFHTPRPSNDAASAKLIDHAHVHLDGFDEHDAQLELDLPHDDPMLSRSLPPRRPSLPERASVRPLRPSTPEEEARAAVRLSGYGEPPQGLIDAARYVLHVIRRSFKLRRERHALERHTHDLTHAREAAATELGRALYADKSLTRQPALNDAFARADGAEAELVRRNEAVKRARAEEQANLVLLEEKRAAIESQLAPYLAAERKAASENQRCEAELKRKRAQHQRLDIELRAMERATVPPPPERRQHVETELRGRASELAALVKAHADSERALGQARHELALRRGSLDATERDQAKRRSDARTLDTRLQGELGAAEEALARELRAIAEIAHSHGLAAAHPSEAKRLDEAEDALDALVEQIATYDRALARYHRPTLVKGMLVWMTLAAVLLYVVTSL